MSYIVPVHRPTSTRHAIKLSFVQPDEDALVVAKANRLEIYTQTSEGFTLLASKTVYGYITMLERLRPASAATDYLFVGTDRYQYFTCSWDAEKKHLVTQQSYVDVADKQLRDSREMDRCNIDSTSRYMTLELYDGVVTVVPITQPQQGPKKQRMDRPAGSLGEPVQVRVEEMMTRDSAFVHSTDPKQSPQLAILWEDNSEVPQLKIRELKFYPESAGDPASAEMKTVAELRADLHLGVSHLIPVPSPLGGFLILGERAIYYSDSGLNDLLQQDLDDDATIWTCWTKVDDHRWLLADDYGHLFFLMISTRNGAVNGWKLEAVGTASKASCLIYLDEGYVFVGSHSGNSQIVKIVPGGVEVLQEFDNIAPILDFSIMDLGRGAEGPQATEFSTGQARLVTASGAWQDGSIRSVRSGVGMEELGTVGEFDHITDLWSLNTTVTDQFDDILVTAFAEQTRVFRFDASGAVEEVPDFNGFELQETTLLAVNLPDRKLLQIHESGVRIADQDSGMLISQWKPSDGGATITAASANSVHILVVESGHTLHLFHISNDLTPTVSKTFTSDSQISGVTLPHSRSSSCIISFWQSASVAILDLHSLETIAVQTLGEPGIAIPRALVVADVLPDSPPTLFIAMADGTVVTYNFDITKNSLNGMTRILLGTEPVFFKLLPRDPYAPGNGTGLSNIFASCEQPCLIYASEGRIVYSAVNSDKASRVCQFNNEGFPAAIAIATPTELKLAVIGTERTTQIQTLPVQETVRCLAYEPRINLFGMGCVRRILEKGQEALMSCVKIADEVSFQELDSYELEDNELVECIISTGPLDAELEDLGFEEMFVVGTSLLHEVVIDGEDVVKGRILVFEANKEKKLSLLASRYVKGACRSLGMCDGKIVAGLVKTVVVCSLQRSTQISSLPLTINKIAVYRTSTNPLDLAVTPATSTSPATIAVADLMKSLSIVSLSPPGTKPEVKGPSAVASPYEWSMIDVARHFATVWSSAVACIGEHEWLLADMEGNLMVLRRNINGPTADDRKRLELIAEFRLGEVANKIKPIMSAQALQNLIAEQGKGKARAGSLIGAERPSGLQDTAEAQYSGPLVYPSAFIATVEGALYLHGTVSPAFVDVLLRLQSAIASRIQAPGYMPWSKFRAVRTEVREAEEPYRTVDGEVLELLLGMDADVLDAVVEELNVGIGGKDGKASVDKEMVKGWVEGLRRLY